MPERGIIMHRGIAFILCFAFIIGATGIQARERTRTVEFSIAGALQAQVHESATVYFMTLPVRCGVYITPDILVEAEAIITGLDQKMTWEDTQWGYILSLNASYNFPLSNSLEPFILLGYGLTDSNPYGNVMAANQYGNYDMTVGVFNAGAGIKVFFSRKAALRIDYRLQKFSAEKTSAYSDYYYEGVQTIKVDYTQHSLFFGVSLFI
jgi:hypothetical protein